MERDLRRIQSILSITGIGVIIFGLWSFLKINLYFLLARELYFQAPSETLTFSPSVVYAITFAIIIFFESIILLLHIYVGRAAIHEAGGVKKPHAYLGIVIFMIILNALGILGTLTSLNPDSPTFFDQIASEIVDITVFIMLIELALATIKLRKLRKM